ncbi:divalent cation tolerance protein CutA [Methyloradius palustris]|uniref:divalent cation tolerance protein CutA n=1 Tax=Methyloradius palustris TaxID=2778876 RepID=UPI00384F8B79
MSNIKISGMASLTKMMLCRWRVWQIFQVCAFQLSISKIVIIKSTLARYTAFEAVIQSMHAYELPEIIHVSINVKLEA